MAMNDTKTYYLHLSIWKVPDQLSTYRMEFWTNDTTFNAQSGSLVRCFPIAKHDFPEHWQYGAVMMEMKKKMINGDFDDIVVMGDLTVKDLRMLGVAWR